MQTQQGYYDMEFALKGLLDGVIERLTPGGTNAERPQFVNRVMAAEQLLDPESRHDVSQDMAASLSLFDLSAVTWPMHGLLQKQPEGEIKIVIGFSLQDIVSLVDTARPFIHISRGRRTT